MSRLLLVDDNAGDTELFSLAAEEVGWQPDMAVAADGIEALELLEAACRDGTAPDLAIIDLNMPRMNGWQLLSRMRELEHCRDIHRVILTSSSIADDCERALRLGAEHCYIKPAQFTDLLELIGEIRRRVGSGPHPAQRT